ncbi:MAG: GNAT family N-acetyltransferase [archaeon]|nr:GNAT family N-acetyltransferase [archaeon]
MIIKPASRKDLFEFSAIEKEIFEEDAFGILILQQFLKKSMIFDKLIDKNTSEVIGFAIISKLRGNERNKEIIYNFLKKQKIKCCHIANFVIKKGYWGKGIGNRFLIDILNKIRKENCDYIILEVNKSNERAIELYHKHGFHIIGELTDYYASGADAFVMINEN